MRLRVRYHRLADFVADYDEQIARGGLLVRVDPPASLLAHDDVELELAAPRGSILIAAKVLQLFPEVGVAVAFDPSPQLHAAAANARTAADAIGGPPQHDIVGEETGEPPGVDPRPTLRQATPINAKMHLALHGDRDERAAILRDINPTLHAYVLRNPGIQLDEVVAIAKQRTVTPEVLKAIGDRREWAQRPDIAIALIRNPKTPVPLALRLLDHVSPSELRQLAKDTNTRAAIQQAARKKVVG